MNPRTLPLPRYLLVLTALAIGVLLSSPVAQASVTTGSVARAPVRSAASPATVAGKPWPSQANTGWQHTGVTLTAYTGPSTITQANTAIDGKDIRGCLYIKANNVTIRNSRITCAGSSPQDGGTMVVQQSDAYTPGVTGLTMTDVEITRPAGNTGGADYGLLLYGKAVTLTRINIHNVTSGIHFSGDGVTLRDSYIGDMVNISGSDHNDAVIANGGAPNVTLIHNTLEVPGNQTTPIAMYPEGSPNSYWIVRHNLLNGGGYCIYPSYTKGVEQPNHHITITNNVFGSTFFTNCGAYGPVNSGPNGAHFLDGQGNTWSGNTWAKNGLTVSSS